MAGTKFKLREIFRFCLLLCFVFVVGIVVDADSSDLGQSQTPNLIPAESDGSELSSVFRRLVQLEQRNEKVIGEMKVLKEQFKSLQESCDARVKSLSEKLSGVESKISEDGGLWLLTPPVRGPPGKPGVKGETGQDGRKGESGRDGGHGVPGSIGPKGETGQVGPQGRPGQDGKPGVKGESGTKGVNGDRGLQGERGQKGESGPAGQNGNPGVKGEIGLEGPKLKDGENGPPGPKGERGFSALQLTSCSVAMQILPSSRSKKQKIYPHGNSKSLEVLCDFETDGGGWTVIQKRTSGPKEVFKQNWNKYVNGFGTLDGNFWLGLDNIRALTQNGDQELRIELADFEGEKKWAKYSRFSISDASDFYRLTLDGFYENSTLKDDMKYNNGQKFTTIDNDNDNDSRINCARSFGGDGGWWFGYCGNSNLNGLYFEKGEYVLYGQGIWWQSWKGSGYSMEKTEMKIRKRKS